MKNLFVSVLTALLVAAGLVFAPTPASAAPCPDQGCTYTETQAVGLSTRARQKARVFVDVASFGSGRPRGVVKFTFVNERTGRSLVLKRGYPGGGRNSVFGFRPLAKGSYTVVVSFAPASDTILQGSSATADVKVRGARRR